MATQQTIVFAATRHHVEVLHEVLAKAGLSVACIYGTLDPAARKIALGKFRAGKSKLLLVTDVLTSLTFVSLSVRAPCVNISGCGGHGSCSGENCTCSGGYNGMGACSLSPL